MFVLPKGPSGKVKLPPKNAPADSKEVCGPQIYILIAFF